MFAEQPSGLFVPAKFNILPPKGSTRVLMPVPERQWRAPSHAVALDAFGMPTVRTEFSIIARLQDGHPIAKVTLEDRDEADWLFYSILRAQVTGERLAIEDQHMPSMIGEDAYLRPWATFGIPAAEWFDPDLLGREGLTFELATSDAYTATGANSISQPVGWNVSNNLIEILAGGGGGGRATAGHGCGGGGGEYYNYANYTFSGTTNLTIGTGGAIQTGTANAGNSGTQSFFGGASYAAAVLGANGGSGGAAGSGSRNGGAAGTGGKGTATATSGRGGNMTGASGTGASGGGAPGGPGGFGDIFLASDSSSTGSSVVTSGGNGNGPLWADGNGHSGQGGNGRVTSGTNPGSNYGAAGGGASVSATSGGAGAQGYGFITSIDALPSNGNFLAFF